MGPKGSELMIAACCGLMRACSVFWFCLYFTHLATSLEYLWRNLSPRFQVPLSATRLLPDSCPPGDISDAVFSSGTLKPKHGLNILCDRASVRDLARTLARARWLPA